ncbi:hypothetical protein ACHQM5_009128 [Ranunculus cassubicifolius]
MGRGGRHVTRMTRHSQAHSDTNVVNSQAVLGATTRVEGSPNTSNVRQLRSMFVVTPEGKHVPKMSGNTQAGYDASTVNMHAGKLYTYSQN